MAMVVLKTDKGELPFAEGDAIYVDSGNYTYLKKTGKRCSENSCVSFLTNIQFRKRSYQSLCRRNKLIIVREKSMLTEENKQFFRISSLLLSFRF
jgi:hypothetical protein